ncbi:MAG TPA: site-specific integrase [Desulfuromonadales bacterium]|nr:site-specific integrase [Desulfuromonadales bacterium]
MLDTQQIRAIVEDYKQSTLASLLNARREYGAIAYLPPRLREGFAEAPAKELVEAVIKEHSNRQEDLALCVNTNDHAGVSALADSLLEEHGEQLDSKTFRLMCEYLLKAQIDISQTVVKRMMGDFSSTQSAVTVPITKPLPAAPKLSELFAAYKAIKTARNKWSTKTAENFERFYKEAIGILGDKELPAYTQEDAIALIEAWKGNSKGTASGKMEFLSSLFRYALKSPDSCDRWQIRGNPFTEMQIEGSENEAKKKLPYSNEDLINLATGLLSVKRSIAPHRFWVPLIAMYSGMRQDEICQLRTADIALVDGVPVFHICHKPELRQTTKAKKLKVCPVHPMLIKLGLIEFLEAQKLGKQDRLFSTLSYSQGKDWTGRIRTWWNTTYQTKHIKDCSGKSFHSIRHSFINWFKQNACYETYRDRSIVQSMVGHTEGDVTSEHYEQDYLASDKLKILSKLDYGLSPELVEALIATK